MTSSSVFPRDIDCVIDVQQKSLTPIQKSQPEKVVVKERELRPDENVNQAEPAVPLRRGHLLHIWLASLALYVLIFSPVVNKLSTTFTWEYGLFGPVVFALLQGDSSPGRWLEKTRSRVAAARLCGRRGLPLSPPTPQRLVDGETGAVRVRIMAAADARATQMGAGGELNVGQLVRERHGAEAVLVGFSTYEGTVTAASDWGAPAERKRVRPALGGSYEALFHEWGAGDFMLDLRDDASARAAVAEPRMERAIGVIYRPQTERLSHYFQARLPGQFDAILHYDDTRAVEPLERTAQWEQGELPETFPTAL